MPNGPAAGSGTQSIDRTVRNSFDAVACSMISTLADVLMDGDRAKVALRARSFYVRRAAVRAGVDRVRAAVFGVRRQGARAASSRSTRPDAGHRPADGHPRRHAQERSRARVRRARVRRDRRAAPAVRDRLTASRSSNSPVQASLCSTAGYAARSASKSTEYASYSPCCAPAISTFEVVSRPMAPYP